MSLSDLIAQQQTTNKILSRIAERLAPERETSTIVTLDGVNSVAGFCQSFQTIPLFNQVTGGLVQGTVWVYLGNVKPPADGRWGPPFLIFEAGQSVPTPIGARRETVITVVVPPLSTPALGTLIFYNY